MANRDMIANMKQGSMQHKQAAQTLKKALEEDPTVFQYDELYDDMDRERQEKKQAAKAERKPKYIAELKKNAERRQRENDRRMEKQVQKELEKEGDKFKDKEQFVTSAYKKKMEELRQLEEEERRQDALDELTDVTKQKDLSGFYRHLYRQTVTDESDGKSKKVSTETASTSKATESDDKSDKETEIVQKRSSPRRGHSSESDTKDSERPRTSQHRDREKGRDRHHDKRHHHRDRSRDRSRSHDRARRRDRESDRFHEKNRDHHREDRSRNYERRRSSPYRSAPRSSRPSRHHHHHASSRSPTRSPALESDRRRKSQPKVSSVPETPIAKENIQPPTKTPWLGKLKDHPVWKKRTVGGVFEAARERYFERLNMDTVKVSNTEDDT